MKVRGRITVGYDSCRQRTGAMGEQPTSEDGFAWRFQNDVLSLYGILRLFTYYWYDRTIY